MDNVLPNQVPGPPIHRVPTQRSGPKHGLWAGVKGHALAGGSPASTPATPAPSHIRSAEHLAVLEDLLARTEQLEQLLTTYMAVQEQRGVLASQLQPSDNTSVTALWQQAVGQLDEYLGQTVRLSPNQTEPLLEAIDTLRHWVSTIRSNARGADGETLQDSPERLTKLLGRMTDLRPSIQQLLEAGERLLSDPALQLHTLQAHAAARAKQADAAALRTSELTRATAVLTSDIGPRLASLRGSMQSRIGILSGLADNVDSSSELTTEARQAIRDLEAIDIESLEVRLQSIQEWVNRYAADPSLTGAVITHRIQQELLTPLDKAEVRLAELEIQYQPERLTTAERQRQQAQFASLGEQLDAQLKAIQQRYQVLVGVRRTKLGTDPDERYYGAIAKQVNDAISQLGEQENRLLGLRASIATGRIDSYTSLRSLVATEIESVRSVLGESDRFATDSALEATLVDAWKHALRPLELLLQKSREALERSTALITEFAHHEGMSAALGDHIRTLQDALRRSTLDAQEFVRTANEATGSGRGQLEATAKAHQRDVEHALREMAPLAERGQFQALLADEVLQAQLAAEARRADEQRAEQAARARLPEQLRALTRARTRLGDRLRTILGYATALEPLDGERAEQIYQQLDAVLTLPLVLPILDCQTLGEALSNQQAWQQLEQTALGGHDSFRAIELSVRELEVTFGPAGRLTELLTDLETQSARQPLHRFQSLARKRRTIEDLLRSTTTDLALLEAEQLTMLPAMNSNEDDHRAARLRHELERIGAELGRVRSLLKASRSEQLAGAEALLTDAHQTVSLAEEDVAAAKARFVTRQRDDEQRSDASARRRLREKLQATLADRHKEVRGQELVASSNDPSGLAAADVDTLPEVASEELPVQQSQPEEISIPVRHVPTDR